MRNQVGGLVGNTTVGVNAAMVNDKGIVGILGHVVRLAPTVARVVGTVGPLRGVRHAAQRITRCGRRVNVFAQEPVGVRRVGIEFGKDAKHVGVRLVQCTWLILIDQIGSLARNRVG